MRVSCLLLALLLPSAAPLQAGEDYYVLLFGCQRIPDQPNYSHTFGTFVKVTWPGNGPCSGKVCLEAHTISWLPANLVVRSLALLPEPGHNYGMDASLRYAFDNGERVSMWGPYRIQPGLYCRALNKIARLESGAVEYKASDGGYNTDKVSNCYHAVGMIVGPPRLRVVLAGWGESATYDVLKKFEPWILDKNCPQYWISTAMGLDRYPIIYRDWRRPFSDAVIGPAYRLLGGEAEVCPSYGPPSSRSAYEPARR